MRGSYAYSAYSRGAVALLYALLLAFLYPFYLVISGLDPNIPAQLQTEQKTVYYLQELIPMLCLGLISLYKRAAFLARFSPWLGAYCALCVLSSAWSADPYVSFKFSTRLVLYVLALAALFEVM